MTHRFLASLGLLAALLGSGCLGTETVVDEGTGGGSGETPPDTETPTEEPSSSVSCALGLVAHEDGGEGAVELSNDGLTASSSGRVQIARAAASRVGGRWYYEVTVDNLVHGDFWAQNIGASVEEVISTVGDTAYMGALYNTTGTLSSGGDGSTRIGVADSAVQEDPFATGDVIGVALDLDAGRVYFSKNGAWLGGMDPEAGTGGVEILVVPGTGAYYPVLYLADGDVMTANFGASEFAHAAPEGFSPFAEDLEEDDDGRCVDEGPAGRPAPPAPVEAACADLTSYKADAAGETELHVIGIHKRGEGGPRAAVHVSRTSPLVLALSSYAFTQWTVTVAPDAQLQQIVLVGHEPSRVTAPAGVPISTLIYNKDGSRIEAGHVWPNAPGGNDTPDLIRSVEEITGLTMTSFAGCLDGASFTVVDDE
ncbi:SPRY domain-containing protein [Sorangium sp. So ce1024]|uniref:SPRY domain-containing protein n=1 Tax=unclassified Sorangium TaxID=2621164 RepID=UPI003F0DA416